MSLPRIYGEILGLIAFAAVMLRGFAHGADLESAASYALASLMIWGLVGCVIGAIADMAVTEAVRQRLLNQLKQRAEEPSRAAR